MELINLYCAMGGFIAGILIGLIHIVKLKNELRQAKRSYEKKSVGMDDSSLKIKTLENKIKTLETALKKSLEN